MKRYLLLVSLGLAACTVEPDPFVVLRITGTVAQGGVPAPAKVELLVGQTVNGRTFPDGTFELSPGGGGLPSMDCGSVAVRAQLLAPDLETVLGSETRNLGECGEHVVDFVFP